MICFWTKNLKIVNIAIFECRTVMLNPNSILLEVTTFRQINNNISIEISASIFRIRMVEVLDPEYGGSVIPQNFGHFLLIYD